MFYITFESGYHLSSSKKIQVIKNKTNYTLATLHIDSIWNGEKIT